jgi:hypothetical protein
MIGGRSSARNQARVTQVRKNYFSPQNYIPRFARQSRYAPMP